MPTASIFRDTKKTRLRVSATIVAVLLAAFLATRAAGQESGGSLPDLLGDFFDGGSRLATITADASFFANGVLIPGTSQTVLALEADFVGFPDDIFAVPKVDGSGNVVPKTFEIIDEPLPPSEIPTSPGPGFTYVDGTAVFTGSTDQTTPSPDPLPPPGEDGTYFVNYAYAKTIAISAGGVGVRRIKLSENNSPIPTDRVIFNYHFFNDVQNGFGDVSRYTMGIEKTYANGDVSFELRVPFAATLDALQAVEAADHRNFEFGNAVMIWKALLARNNRWAFTVGTGVSLPLASSYVLLMGDTNILKVVNESVHILPYVATAWTPNSRVFAEAFVQFDIDPYGNTVLADVPNVIDPPSGRRRLPQIGVLNDATFLFVDVGTGVWVYRNPNARWLNGVAPVAELHYSTTTSDTDVVSGNNLELRDLSRRLDILNLTLATHLTFQSGLEVSSGVAIPLRTGDDDPFDYEVSLQCDWKF